MNSKFVGRSLAVLGYWAIQAQDVLAQASGAASGGGGAGTFGRGPIIVWVVGAAVIGFGVGYAVGSNRSNSSSQ
jgi:hypothetical protein